MSLHCLGDLWTARGELYEMENPERMRQSAEGRNIRGCCLGVGLYRPPARPAALHIERGVQDWDGRRLLPGFLDEWK
jgi:hypothetical protein